ncbi:MAG: cyclic nucleotide-binding domain-containing protein [bacterium]|nr:cyclic nucleotide-binding domain-containing protein [bacterium]
MSTSNTHTSEEIVLQLLRRVHFLDSLKIAELKKLAGLTYLYSARKGEIIFHQGDPPDRFYILGKGSVEVICEVGSGSEVVATLGRSGDFFGEMALIDDSPRSATIKAATAVKLLVLTRAAFDDLIQEHPGIQFEITRALTHNLRHTDSGFVATILEKNRQLAETLAKLREAQEELLRRERLSLVGKLASGIIHDLKKPLTCISGYAQLLGGDSYDTPKRHQYSDKITHEVKRLVDMINEILQFARGEQQINRQQVDLREWVNDAAELMQCDFENSHIEFHKEIRFDTRLSIDPEKFKSVFYNIAANALAAMPRGGKFTFVCDRSDEGVRMDFIDNGVGMAPDVQKRVFDEFFSQRKDGTGLGMAIVKRIIEAHHGNIEVQSKLNQGTTFTILLPLEG